MYIQEFFFLLFHRELLETKLKDFHFSHHFSHVWLAYFFFGLRSLFRHLAGMMPFAVAEAVIWFGGEDLDDDEFDEFVLKRVCWTVADVLALFADCESVVVRDAIEPHAWWCCSQFLCWQNDPQYRAIPHPPQVSLAFLPQFQHV